MDEHYEKPEWLKGTAWEVLSNEYGGKFSMFLEAAELSGFKPILDGKRSNNSSQCRLRFITFLIILKSVK